ncbi:protein translocase subunit SecD [Agromyces aerolatus]|uniref:protein translocase subunit SecD n=1 Tax=Agromyces sp. LY-1074 TaxID=3074080 RepID=UPI002854F599|nr:MULTISPECIES: protein translocase subunit SecD [unclassified Agromyces]MDR5700606.1 protein translocase subunit SecD [Agromyces sp. LY-1074]MDR5707127.1 protein translocase subunit SecD [Agromyces sp. LY-1358]
MAAPSKRSSRPAPVRKAWRSLTWLGVIIVGLFAINAAGVIWGGGSWTPKLALDLEGGTQIILAPQLEDGQTASQEQLDQAVSIIRQRVDASGVAEAEINTEGNNVVVRIPGELDDQTRARIESSAKLELRPVLLAGAATTQSIDPTASPDAADPAEGLATEPTVQPTDGSDMNWVTPALQAQYDAFDCAALDDTETNVAPAADPLVTCDQSRTVKYLLGPVEVSGENIVDATNGMVQTSTGGQTGQWAVNIVFDGTGTEEFAKVSTRLFGLKGQTPRDQFAFVLDGAVLSAPSMNGVITDGRPQITGQFDQESSKALADQLKFGALPISFTVQSSDTISPTLGTSQLQSGLIAGLIGLILVVIYTLFQYRALASVTIASLIIAGIITYLMITILSWREGYRLSLAGIAGLIVAIGFTADSFIIYFERVRDELRDGRLLIGAVEAGWKRAFRTILASKGVNLLAAVVLFILAVGSVKGFAYTLGLTTIIDVVVVILFTHPMLQLLAQTKFFSSGNSWSGLDPTALGAVYRGRAEFRTPVAAGRKSAASQKEAQKRQTIAERKAAGVGATTGSDESKES